MKKKNIFIHLVLTALILIVFGSCDKRERLYIYNWTYYTPDSVIEKFEKEYNVRVVYDEFTSNEEMYAKLKAGGGGYDIVFPSKDYALIMINQEMLEKIDHSLLNNLGNIDQEVLQIANYDPNMEYSVPYFYGAAGIIVNTLREPNFDRSWSIFEREDLRGRMTMLDDMREVMGAALIYLGHSANTINPAEIIEARDLINQSWKPNLIKFEADTFGKGYADGEFWVVHGYPDGIFDEIKELPIYENTVFFIPNEGGPSYIDSMVILKGSKNYELAHKFIDFIHRPEIYAEIVDEFGLPATVNIPARGITRNSIPMYHETELENTELVEDVGSAYELYTNAWFNSIRAGD